MESCFYETIHETDLLHVRFELQDAPAFVFPAHWHEYVEILYLIRGQFSAIVQATEYRLNEGDLIIINSGDSMISCTEASYVPYCVGLRFSIFSRIFSVVSFVSFTILIPVLLSDPELI